ncbi:HDL102Cp [Eremothecium sinecaudum]|uniref:HDL102Cp n=1 Tax=Eremothecium sinecaudum TaxID=45286 RepID=A0A120K276_9SACH|nr:HDL102Cp [Eremothecium sinecaudum]AMD20642.1 HDL102Cp [Eremothecium sinecaudum]
METRDPFASMEVELGIALAIIKQRNPVLWNKLTPCCYLEKLNHSISPELSNISTSWKKRSRETYSGQSKRQRLVDHSGNKNKNQEAQTVVIHKPDIVRDIEDNPNYASLEGAVKFIKRNAKLPGRKHIAELSSEVKTVSSGFSSKKVTSWILPTYRRLRWILILPNPPSQLVDMVRAFAIFIVSYYAYHSTPDSAFRYVTKTLFYKFNLEMWDKTFRSLTNSKDVGHLFLTCRGSEALIWSRLCREQRRMAEIILVTRSRFRKTNTMVVRCISNYMHILESLVRCYLRIKHETALYQSTSKRAYEQIHNHRTRTFDNKYEIEMMEVLGRQGDSTKDVIETIDQTFKILKGLDWKQIHLSKVDRQELASYRKYVQSSLLLTGNTNLIADFRLAMDGLPKIHE